MFAIRPGRPEDLAAIVSIYNHYVIHTAATFDLDPIYPGDRAEWIQAHLGPGPYRLLVAIDAADRVTGWATTSPFRPRAGYATTVESSVYVRPDQLGRGVGTRLYAALFDAIRVQPIERIVAGIALPNPASESLHHRFGFRRIGVFSRVGRKFGRFWDVAWFERGREVDRSAGEADRFEGADGPHLEAIPLLGGEPDPREPPVHPDL